MSQLMYKALRQLMKIELSTEISTSAEAQQSLPSSNEHAWPSQSEALLQDDGMKI